MTLFWAFWRSLAYRAAAVVSPRYTEQARQWTAAWHRREEWRNGPPSGVVGKPN